MTIPEQMVAALERGIAERADHAGPLRLHVREFTRNLSADDVECLKSACLARGWRYITVEHISAIEYRRSWP